MRLGAFNGLRLLLIAEECQNYVRARGGGAPSTGERIVNELRSYSVGVVLISPDPVRIPWHIARDVVGIVAMGFQSPPDFLVGIIRGYGEAGLRRTIQGGKIYIYRMGRIHLVRAPRPAPAETAETEKPEEAAGEVKEAGGLLGGGGVKV